jgi:hypothetical protein
MAKFRDIAKGSRARRPFAFTLPGGTEVACALVGIFGESEGKVLAGARQYAVDHGLPEPMNGDPLYEFGIWVHTLLHGIVDPNSPEDRPEPFFGSVAEILDEKDGLDRERIALLFEAQQAFQDELSPRPKSMSLAEFSVQVIAHGLAGEEEELPFERWRPVLRRSFVRNICNLLSSSLDPSSSTGPGSPGTGQPGSESTNGPSSTTVAAAVDDPS